MNYLNKAKATLSPEVYDDIIDLTFDFNKKEKINCLF